MARYFFVWQELLAMVAMLVGLSLVILAFVLVSNYGGTGEIK